MRRCFLPLLVLAPLAACATPRLEVMPRYGTFDVDGKFGISSSGVSAKNSLGDIGIEKDSGVLGGRADFKWGSPHLTVSTQSSSHGGDGTLSAAIDHDEVTIDAGADVASRLDLDIHNAALTFDVLPGENIELGLGIGVTVFGIDMSIRDELSGDEIATDESIPIPVVSARLAGQKGRFEAAALVSGFSLSYDGDEVSFFDVDVFGRWLFLGGKDYLRGSVVLGYRMVTFDLQYEDSGDEAAIDLNLGGPYFGLQFGL